MIVGSVHPNGEAVIAIRIRGQFGDMIELQVVIDTGFNDRLTLSPALVESLKLPLHEQGRCLLADGSVAITRSFAAEIEWLGRWRRILVVELDGGPLVGMGMLHGSHLGLDVIDGGRVEIRPLDGLHALT